MNILGSTRHKLLMDDGLIIMPLSLQRWEEFPTSGALTHITITWAFLPTAPQVPGVFLGSFFCPWGFWQSSWREAQHTTTPLSFTFHLDVVVFIGCIWVFVKEIMFVQTLAVSRASLRPLLYVGIISGQRPTQIAKSPSSHL